MIRQIILRRQTLSCLKSTPRVLAQTPVITSGPEARPCSVQASACDQDFPTSANASFVSGLSTQTLPCTLQDPVAAHVRTLSSWSASSTLAPELGDRQCPKCGRLRGVSQVCLHARDHLIEHKTTNIRFDKPTQRLLIGYRHGIYYWSQKQRGTTGFL